MANVVRVWNTKARTDEQITSLTEKNKSRTGSRNHYNQTRLNHFFPAFETHRTDYGCLRVKDTNYFCQLTSSSSREEELMRASLVQRRKNEKIFPYLIHKSTLDYIIKSSVKRVKSLCFRFCLSYLLQTYGLLFAIVLSWTLVYS